MQCHSDLHPARRKGGFSDATFYKWRAKFGGMDRVRREAAEGVGGRERQAQETSRRSAPGHACPEERFRDKALFPQVRLEAIGQIIKRFDLSERRACRLVGLTRSSYRDPPVPDQQICGAQRRHRQYCQF